LGWGARFNIWFDRKFKGLLDAYDRSLARTLARPARTVLVLVGLFLLSLGLFHFIGVSYFPRTDPGQFVINVKAPTGTRIELTEQYIKQVEEVVRKVVRPADLKMIVSNIGLTPDFSAMYTPNSGVHTAFVQVALKDGHKLGSYEYMDLVRERLAKELPQLGTYFQTGGLMDAILNLGLPAPIDIQVSGMNLDSAFQTAADIAKRVRALPGVSDVLIPQDVDYPALRLEVDRERAIQLGVSSKEVIDSVITALTSDLMIAPSFWVDPTTGNDYYLTVQYYEDQIKSLQDLEAIPLRSPNLRNPTRLGSVASFRHVPSPTEVDHYQIRRVIDIYVSPSGEDLGTLARLVEGEIKKTNVPEGLVVTMRGMVQGMRSSFSSFAVGLSLSVILVYLILVAQFESFLDPFLILLAIPTGLTGVLLILFLTGTPLNVMSLMGVLLMVGISVSDSILIVEFIRRLREDGKPLEEAVAVGPRVRLRPVLMTTLATLIGLIPMAAKFGEGSETYAPLARAIIGGLAVSALQTVYLVPACYLILHRWKNARESRAAVVSGTEAAA
jgi:multidrug efflux pump subunit AcrB